MNYPRLGIGWVIRIVILLLIAAIIYEFFYNRTNRDYQFENVPILPKINVIDKDIEQFQPAPDTGKYEAQNPPPMPSTNEFTDEPVESGVPGETKSLPDEKNPDPNQNNATEEMIDVPENVEQNEPTGMNATNPQAQLDLETRIRELTNCKDQNFEPKIYRRGDFWVLQNYIRADHGEIRCTSSVTYVTHGDYTFLDNLIPVLERWPGPLSMSLYTPVADLKPTIESIKYLRQCLPKSDLVRKYATFHIFFDTDHVPTVVPKSSEVLSKSYNCSLPPPYLNVNTSNLYKNKQNLTYPVNVARNSARDAALTHFLFVCDIELYPSPDLPRKFLEMFARNEPPLNSTKPKVFPLDIFEVDKSSHVPWTKTELQDLYRLGKIIPFHKEICGSCHKIPEADRWIKTNETAGLNIFTVGQRKGIFSFWEPIFIGTNNEPYYDERLSWEGMSDKMTQSRIMCYLDYEFQILDNAFLVHRPGIKISHKDKKRNMLAKQTSNLIRNVIEPNLKIIFGAKNNVC